jgi:hypothetical protein
MSDSAVTIVLASIDSSATIGKCLRGFLSELNGEGQIVVVDSSRNGLPATPELLSSHVEILKRPPGMLAPVLWREGLLETSSPLVAFSTAQMVPRPGWLAAMRTAMKANQSAGVGGPIAANASLSALDRAMYLLRYANYFPPVLESLAFEPPGDNALYCKADLDAVADSWRDGFWEIEVHKQLRARGRTTCVAPQAIVDFLGGNHLGPALAHRLAHARRFGAGRVRDRHFAVKLVRTAISPAVPPMLLSRIVRNLQARGEPLGPWIPALPFLSVLLATWSAGEAAGALFGSGSSAAA